MRGSVAPWIVLVACGGEEAAAPALSLEGPAEVRVAHLGAVEGPRAVLSDGTEPKGIVWTVTPDRVAAVGAEGAVEAVAPGNAVVVGRWEAQEVRWTLVVAPPVSLRFVDPPATVPVGRALALRIAATLDDRDVDPGELTWSTSDPAVLTVVDGQVTGASAGTAFVTVASPIGSRATVQLQVVP